MRYETAIRGFLSAHPRIKAGARLVMRTRDAIRALPARLFGLGYVSRRIEGGPLKGLWFIAAKRVYYSHWFWKGTYEIASCEFLRDTVAPDAVCYDIGANIGYHAMIMATSAKSGRVYAFEPIPAVCAILEKNAALNGLGNITVVNQAVGNQSGVLTLTRSILIDQASRRDSAVIGTDEESIECKSVTLDAFVAQGHEPPTFLKIDVEGAEGEVMAGGENVLREHRPQILCELHGPVPARLVYEQLIRQGYEMFSVGGTVLRKIESFADVPLNMNEGHLFARFPRLKGDV
jgi:FkbM family methyltransferase